MAFRLTKKESAGRDELVAELEIEGGKLSSAVTEYNDAVKEAREKLLDAVSNYNSKVEEAKDFAAGIAERLRDEWDNKSEGWQSGDRGSEAESFVDAWESFEPSEIDVDEPEELDLELSERDDLESLPEEIG